MTILGFLAAAVPIAGSVWAAVWFLTTHARLRWERDSRKRIGVLQEQWKEALLASTANYRYRRPNIIDEGEAFARRMEPAYGIASTTRTWGDFDADQAMTTPPAALDELKRQWLVLGSAVLGFVFLALDLAS